MSGEYYHIYNRGVDKRDIFNDKKDVRRFLESVSGFNQIDGVGSIRDLRKAQSESKALFFGGFFYFILGIIRLWFFRLQ